MNETEYREWNDPCPKSWREKTEKSIGKNLREKYSEIGTLLDLITYRMEDIGEDYRYALSRLLAFDTLYGKKALTRLAAGLLAPVLWMLSKIRNRKIPKADPRLIFSNTFLLSARYPAAREQIERETGCTAVLAFSDLLKREGAEQKINLKSSLKPQIWNCRPIYLRGRSVCGSALQKALIRYFSVACDPAVPAEERTEERIEKLLRALKRAYLKRTEHIENCLRKENCTLYLTVNQYNLRDLLIINACKNLGIRTVQQEHHAMQFCRVLFDENHPRFRLSIAGEYGFWTRTEKLFHEKVYCYENSLYRPEEIRFRVTGNPEMSCDDAEKFREQYPPERKLTFMIAGLPEAELEEAREQYTKWRWEVFKGLKELAEKQNVIISIRYPPYQEMDFREKEIPVLKKWGFRISESVPGNLMEDLCTSCAVMSSVSSVLCTARIFGKLTFRVAEWEIAYVHVDDEVHEVTPAGIPDIVIPEGIENIPPAIEREAAFSIGKIL